MSAQKSIVALGASGVASVLLLSGCLYPAAALLVAGGSDSGGGGDGKTNVAEPLVEIADTAPDPARRVVTVSVDVTDLDPTDVLLEVDTGGGNFVEAATGVGGGSADPTTVSGIL